MLNRLLAGLERKSAEMAHRLTTPSQTMADYIAKRWGEQRRPVVLPNFMDIPTEPQPPADAQGPQQIVCAGRIERFKGQDILVKAFSIIAAAHPRARLRLIGPDQWGQEPFANLIARLVPQAAIRERITLTGPLPLSQVQRELAEASVAVICSTGFESFSFSTLEAMAAARPIIGCATGAIPELLDQGNCGLIVPRQDEVRLAVALDQLLTNPDLACHLAHNAHARARQCYDTSVVMPQFVRNYALAREAANGWTTYEDPIAQLSPETA
jgi:glycosyltransferase involved in cell wall biosynthesis